MDSPIVIRTADVDLEGRLKVTAGATLVRDSDPAYEVAETHAKAGGILSAFGLVPPAPVAEPGQAIAELVSDEDVLIALNSRNQRLSTFWLTDQGGAPPDPSLRRQARGDPRRRGRLREHAASHPGRARHDQRGGAPRRVRRGLTSTTPTWSSSGPGPGDPRDGDDPKMAALRAAVDRLLGRGQPFLAVCLGHQALCHRLGLPLAFKDIVFQGTQSPVVIGGRTERVGFYNTFVARAGGALPDGVTVEADPETGDIHLVRGPHYRGIQFHAESILTEHGYDLIHDLVRDLLSG